MRASLNKQGACRVLTQRVHLTGRRKGATVGGLGTPGRDTWDTWDSRCDRRTRLSRQSPGPCNLLE